jgi:hypothetical protein
MGGLSMTNQMQKTGTQQPQQPQRPPTGGYGQYTPSATKQEPVSTEKPDFSQLSGRALTTSKGQPVVSRKTEDRATGQEVDNLLKLLEMLRGIQR